MRNFLEHSWKKALSNEFDKDYFRTLEKFIEQEYKSSEIFPEQKNIFKAFELTPIDKVKVVIIGQDPYHDKTQANGLAFSVQDGIKNPPSLANIYKEIKLDTGLDSVTNGDLTNWAKQGVLLMNSSLTVRAHLPASHSKKGWEIFTDSVISELSGYENIVYLLWGQHAQKKAEILDINKNLILKSAHPSPLSSYRGFFGNHHFSKTNEYLIRHKKTPINW